MNKHRKQLSPDKRAKGNSKNSLMKVLKRRNAHLATESLSPGPVSVTNQLCKFHKLLLPGLYKINGLSWIIFRVSSTPNILLSVSRSYVQANWLLWVENWCPMSIKSRDLELCMHGQGRPKLEWPSKVVTVVMAEGNKSNDNIYHVLNTHTLPGTPVPALHTCSHFIFTPSVLSILFSQMRNWTPPALWPPPLSPLWF